jgi:hypothetical protein
MSEQVDSFMAFTGCGDASMAENFLEMAQGDLETAISLFYDHGPSSNNNINNNNNNNSSGDDVSSNMDNDIALAERLQNEAYQDSTRAPDEARHERLIDDVDVFPGTFGGVGGRFNPLLNPDELIYGNQRTGVFNQRDIDFDDEEDEFAGMTEGQKRLAKMFRPPFDIMEKLDLDSAKRKAKQEKKWILVNIQDSSDFLCQTLNRDFWKSSTVKEIVQENFVFLQYHKDSRSGEQYINFYPFKEYPHIAILDPITGERMKMWSGVPKVQKWCDEVYDFLNEFSLDPSTVNPIVKHKPSIDPNSLSEEKQLEYAIKQSLGNSVYVDEDSDLEILEAGNESDPIELDDDTEIQDAPKELTEGDKIKAIKPINHEEPVNSPATTRIQIRTGDGSRLVKRFSVDDKVRKLYELVKYEFREKIGDNMFTLTSQRENLIDKMDESISDAGLKNASVLLEILQDDE